jgi:Zn-dependent metalloprotease
MAKITKREIREGLEDIPIEQILLGSTNQRELTHKQKTFAKQVALGKPKAEAYRHAYDTKAKPPSVASDAHRLANKPDISLMIEAYKRAFEAREYRNPERLRELVIHQLTEMALNPEVKDAQRIKSLELLGKVAEVGAFMDRKETKVIHESSKIKEKLLDQLKTIINIDAKEINSDDADELLREISGSRANLAAENESESSEPTTTRPPIFDHAEGGSPIHSTPHIQSAQKSMLQTTESKEEKNEVETFPPDEEGEGVLDSEDEEEANPTETPPLQNPGEKG